jgi:hypothetical protein
MRSRTGILAIVSAALVLLVGCSAPEEHASMPEPAPPSATPLTAEELAEQALIDSSWSGLDSAGDTTSFTLSADHTVDVEYNETRWDEASDTWSLDEGVLTITVHVDSVHGDLVYTAPYADGAAALAATAVASVSGRTLTVSLARG